MLPVAVHVGGAAGGRGVSDGLADDAGVEEGVADGAGGVTGTSGDAVVTGAGLAADEQAATSRPTTIAVVVCESGERIGCPPAGAGFREPDHGSTMVVVHSTVLSGAIARMLAE